MSDELDRVLGVPETPAKPPRTTLVDRLEQHVGSTIGYVYAGTDNNVQRKLIDVGEDHVVVWNEKLNTTLYVPFTDIRRFYFEH